MTGVCKVHDVGDPICGRPASLVVGNAYSCDCQPHGVVTYSCDDHIAVVLAPGWYCQVCYAPMSHTEPVRI